MRISRSVEIGVGLFVTLGFAALLMLAVEVSGLSSFGGGAGYNIAARFENIGGLKIRAPVTMGGVRVGRVTGVDYDEESYEAVVQLSIDDRFRKIPDDTSASVLTSGLLGEQYVGLEPGGSIFETISPRKKSNTTSADVRRSNTSIFKFMVCISTIFSHNSKHINNCIRRIS